MFRRQILPAVRILAVLTVMVGVAYPLAVTAVAQLTMHSAANGSLVRVHGRVVGSALLGQRFSEAQYFHPRPSAAGRDGYDGSASGGSNLGPSSRKLRQDVATRVAAFRAENQLSDDASVPVDAVTASGSGLDPHISVANARLQAPRVARERGLSVRRVLALVDAHTDARSLGVLGQPGVNVLELNVALDETR